MEHCPFNPCFWAFVVGQHSEPYISPGLMIVLYILSFTCLDKKPLLKCFLEGGVDTIFWVDSSLNISLYSVLLIEGFYSFNWLSSPVGRLNLCFVFSVLIVVTELDNLKKWISSRFIHTKEISSKRSCRSEWERIWRPQIIRIQKRINWGRTCQLSAPLFMFIVIV